VISLPKACSEPPDQKPFSTPCLATLISFAAHSPCPAPHAPSLVSSKRINGLLNIGPTSQSRSSSLAPMQEWQLDLKEVSTVRPDPSDPAGKQMPVVETLDVVDGGTSVVLDTQVHPQFTAQTALARAPSSHRPCRSSLRRRVTMSGL
jgi:hypothetical protein